MKMFPIKVIITGGNGLVGEDVLKKLETCCWIFYQDDKSYFTQKRAHFTRKLAEP